MKIKFLLVSLFFSSLFLNAEEEIFVELPTEESLKPLYFSDIKAGQSSIKPEYLKVLNEILTFDFENNGTMRLLTQTADKEALLQNSSNHEAYNPYKWKRYGAAYVISGEIVGTSLNLKALMVKKQRLKEIKNIPLSGKLCDDRRTIHQLADKIHKLFFGSPGIATSKILYALQSIDQKNVDGESTSEIWMCDYDGGNAHQVTEEKNYCITPAFFPKKNALYDNQFLYINYKFGQPKIFISSLGGGLGKPFLELRGNQLLPTISRNGKMLAFISDASGRADLFIQHLHPQKGMVGKPIQAYSFPRCVQASPTLSPKGKKVAFVSDKGGTPRIYLIDTASLENGKRPEAILLTKKYRENTCPNWSPDGKKLAYSAKVQGVRQIFIYDFEKNEELQLTRSPVHKENPSWAPNSLHLVFNTVSSHNAELYLMNIHQCQANKITSGQGKKHYPAWEY